MPLWRLVAANYFWPWVTYVHKSRTGIMGKARSKYNCLYHHPAKTSFLDTSKERCTVSSPLLYLGHAGRGNNCNWINGHCPEEAWLPQVP